MSKPRKVQSAQILDKYIDEFIKKCETDEEIPSDYLLLKFLDISPSTYDKFKKGGEKEGDTYYGYNEPIKKLINYREARLLRQLEASKGNNTAAIFQLKQPKNGGYSDNQITTGDHGATLTIKVEGVGGLEAFK